MTYFARVPALVLLLSTVTLACADEPEPTDQDNLAGEGDGCVGTPTVLASVDEVSPLGFAAADVLGFAAGEHESPLFWREQNADSMVEVGPESGESTLSITISHEGGEIRYVDYEPAEGGFELDEGPGCADQLEIDVMVQIGSGGGALAENIPVTLTAAHPLLAHFDAAIEPEDIAGSMSVTSLDPQFDVGAIDFDVGVSSYGLSGSITGMVSAEMGDTAVAGFVDYAAFPSATQSCGSDQLALPLDADVLGFTGADALALINRAWLFELTWQGSEPVELTLSAAHDGESVCASLVPGQANRLVFGATITLATGDGVVDAAFPIVVTAEADEQGELGQVHVYKDNAGLLGDAADFAADFGEFGVDVSGYDLAGIDFTGAFVDNDAPGSADGSLTVLAADNADCSGEPGDACEGIDVIELARAEWGNTGVAP
jgi:hypothetical protein